MFQSSPKELFLMYFLFIRCPAKVKLVHATNQVELQDLNHNHPLILGRRQAGEVQKLKEARKLDEIKKEPEKPM